MVSGEGGGGVVLISDGDLVWWGLFDRQKKEIYLLVEDIGMYVTIT